MGLGSLEPTRPLFCSVRRQRENPSDWTGLPEVYFSVLREEVLNLDGSIAVRPRTLVSRPLTTSLWSPQICLYCPRCPTRAPLPLSLLNVRTPCSLPRRSEFVTLPSTTVPPSWYSHFQKNEVTFSGRLCCMRGKFGVAHR